MDKLAKFILDDVVSIKDVDLSFLNGKTVLITGSTGLIGNYLTAFFKSYRNQTGLNFKLVLTAFNEPEKYYLDLFDSTKDVFLAGDLSEINFSSSLPSADLIIHAAGYGQPGKFMDDQLKTLKLNTVVTLNLFEKLLAGGRFLFISSSEVYNGSPNIPYKEDDIGRTNTNNFRYCYIEGKRGGEAICFAHSQKGIEARVARLSLAYGPGTKKTDQRVLNNFIAKGLAGSISLLDYGLANRTYCYVTDAVEIMLDIITKGQDLIYNVGGESKTTIGNLAKKIGSMINVPVIFPDQANPLGGAPDDVSLDLDKIKAHFNKNSFVGLDEGLSNTIEWQRILYSN
jgi:nucleoside-diphosphate-sugar epimerase